MERLGSRGSNLLAEAVQPSENPHSEKNKQGFVHIRACHEGGFESLPLLLRHWTKASELSEDKDES